MKRSREEGWERGVPIWGPGQFPRRTSSRPILLPRGNLTVDYSGPDRINARRRDNYVFSGDNSGQRAQRNSETQHPLTGSWD